MRKNGKLLGVLLLMAGYLLGIHEGHLALWEGDDPAPRYIFSVRTATLTQDQRAALASGIRVPDQEALLRLLQEYL